jgi:hypothetical protein
LLLQAFRPIPASAVDDKVASMQAVRRSVYLKENFMVKRCGDVRVEGKKEKVCKLIDGVKKGK